MLHGDPIAYAPRGLSRDEAARYIGVGTTKFDQLVADKRMPKPRRIDGLAVWDRVQLELAFNELPTEKTLREEVLRRFPKKN